ncbi:tetratricopeptide repeat protein [Acidocella sp.]|uniref:tetratricopeptide repeat protein n=1 Tax=Acidocella sp. TaxID=50710 RepID=UPI003CFD7306
MRTDWLGNGLSVGEAGTVAGIDDFIEGFLGYETKAANILKAVEAEPEACLPNAYAALFYMFLESQEAPNLARPFLEAAERAAPGASERERMTVAATRAWVDNDIPRAVKIADMIAQAYPRDLAMVKTAQYHHFNLGNAAGMLAIAETVEESNLDIPYMHGLVAFGYEQCHLLPEAEKAAWRAIELKRKEPWAQHALAHVFLTTGRIEAGVAFLEEASTNWTDLNSFMSTHNWWHLALNYISLGRYEDTLALYDRHVWGIWKEYSQDQIGAVSLLLRLELAGVDVGERWRDVAEHMKGRTNDFVQPFITMQYVYGLARAGYAEADELMDNLHAFARTAPLFVRSIWEDVAVPACEGLVAHARGAHEQVVARMGAAISRIMEAGGSHAQRDLFEQVLLDSMIRSGRYSTAQQMLEIRRGYHPDSVPANTALALVYGELGLPREAARARARLRPRA